MGVRESDGFRLAIKMTWTAPQAEGWMPGQALPAEAPGFTPDAMVSVAPRIVTAQPGLVVELPFNLAAATVVLWAGDLYLRAGDQLVVIEGYGAALEAAEAPIVRDSRGDSLTFSLPQLTADTPAILTDAPAAPAAAEYMTASAAPRHFGGAILAVFDAAAVLSPPPLHPSDSVGAFEISSQEVAPSTLEFSAIKTARAVSPAGPVNVPPDVTGGTAGFFRSEDSPNISQNIKFIIVDPDDNEFTIGVDSSTLPPGVTYDAATQKLHLHTQGHYDYLNVGEQENFAIIFTIADEHGGSTTEDVTLRVTGVNDAPVMEGQRLTTDEDTKITGLLSATDPDNDSAVYSAVGALPAGATLNPDGSFSFDPAGNYDGLEAGDTASISFQVKANDGTAGSNVATVTIEITGVAGATLLRGGDVLDGPESALGTGLGADVAAKGADAVTGYASLTAASVWLPQPSSPEDAAAV